MTYREKAIEAMGGVYCMLHHKEVEARIEAALANAAKEAANGYRLALQEVVDHLEIVADREPVQIEYALNAARDALKGEMASWEKYTRRS